MEILELKLHKVCLSFRILGGPSNADFKGFWLKVKKKKSTPVQSYVNYSGEPIISKKLYAIFDRSTILKFQIPAFKQSTEPQALYTNPLTDLNSLATKCNFELNI